MNVTIPGKESGFQLGKGQTREMRMDGLISMPSPALHNNCHSRVRADVNETCPKDYHIPMLHTKRECLPRNQQSTVLSLVASFLTAEK